MKKMLAMILALVMIITVVPASVLAFDQYVVYAGQTGCQLTDFTFTQTNNPWLLWDVTFSKYCDDRVWETTDDHPNLVGRTVIPSFTFEGAAVTFNGTAIESDVTEIVLQAENELVVTTDTARAEYQISITEETNGLPVVLIDTDNAAIPDKVNYVTSTISVLGADIHGGDDIYAAPAGIKLRGNSTMGYDKKPYRIKFDKKQDVFGLGKAKSWVLLANYLDPSAIRNEIAYKFATRLNAYTAETTGFQVYVPRVRPVEVYLNGEYKGLYDMGDHVQVDSTRIAIDESGDEFDDNDVQLYPEGDVGYYLEVEDPSRVIAEWYSESAYYVTIENSGGTGVGTLYTGNQTSSGSLETAGTGTLDTLYVQVKTPEIPSAEQVSYIGEYLQTVNDLILAKDDAVFDYIDIDSFVDWYLANELFKNTDSGFLSSVKLHKDKGGKLRMGPVWDFDIGSGAVAYSEIDNPTGWRTRTTERCAWYETLFTMDTFVTAVETRWADIRDNGIVDQVFTDIDTLSAQMGDSAVQNYDMWHQSYVNAVNNTGWLSTTDRCLNGTWSDQVQTLNTYMQARVQWFDEQFGYGDKAAYVNMLSSTLSTTSRSKTFNINKSFNVTQMPNLYLSVTSRNAFNITFNFDIGSPSLSTDWLGTKPELPFQGTTGDNIPAGTYTDKVLNIDNYIPWSSDPTATVVTLNSITITTTGSNRSVQVTGLYASDSVQANVEAATSTTLGGSVAVIGKPEYGVTFAAETMAVTPYGASLSYQWYADGTAISGATASTFEPSSDYIGQAIHVVVKPTSSSYSGSVASEAVTLLKAPNDYATSQVPTLVSKTDTTLVITEREGYDISIDGVNWQSTGTFTDLTPNTLYRVYYRHGEFPTQQAGLPGANILRVITDVNPNAPEQPEQPEQPEEPTYIVGDVSGDGVITTTDARMAMLHALEGTELTGDALAAADFNGDGEITTLDARNIMLYALMN